MSAAQKWIRLAELASYCEFSSLLVSKAIEVSAAAWTFHRRRMALARPIHFRAD